jgi:prepilin-type N-terminal cleavage/methylation domain-containing protein
MFNELKLNENGFTFLEIIFVILLLTILATVAMLNYSGLQQSAVNDLALTDLKVIRAALRSYHLENNDFPATGLDELTTQGFLDENPDDKCVSGGGIKYQYRRDSASSCTVWSAGSGLTLTVTP